MPGRRRNSHRPDDTHGPIRDGLRRLGETVADVHEATGFCDLVVARGNRMLEVKPEGWTKPRNEKERKQAEWREAWIAAGGQVDVVRNLREALVALGYELKE